jgi:hypothetical protein
VYSGYGGYGGYGNSYGGYSGHGYGYGKRSADAEPSRAPDFHGVTQYQNYDLGRQLGYFAYRGYPNHHMVVHKREASNPPNHYGHYGFVNYSHRKGF